MGTRVKIMLPELIDELNISMRELSRLTDVRAEALNELGQSSTTKNLFQPY